MFIVLCTIYCVQYLVYTLLCALSSKNYIMNTILWTLFCVHYLVYTILCTLNGVHYHVYTILCTLACAHFIVYAISCKLKCQHYLLYNMLCTLYCVPYIFCKLKCLHYIVYNTHFSFTLDNPWGPLGVSITSLLRPIVSVFINMQTHTFRCLLFLQPASWLDKSLICYVFLSVCLSVAPPPLVC